MILFGTLKYSIKSSTKEHDTAYWKYF